MNAAPSPSRYGNASVAWDARVDLAAALRIAVLNHFHEGIDNHFSLTLPHRPEHYLLNPFGLHWSEIRASDLLEVDSAGDIVGGRGRADRSATAIHGPIHARGRACVLHTHMPYATALTQLEDMTVEMSGQNALDFHGRIAYDYDYRGLAETAEEGHRLADALGDADILMMANHGVIVCRPSMAQAFHDLYFLERACMTQMIAMATGRPRRIVPAPLAQQTARQFVDEGQVHEKPSSTLHFEALKRVLDRANPGYDA